MCQKYAFYGLLVVLSGRFGESYRRAGDLACIRGPDDPGELVYIAM